MLLRLEWGEQTDGYSFPSFLREREKSTVTTELFCYLKIS